MFEFVTLLLNTGPRTEGGRALDVSGQKPKLVLLNLGTGDYAGAVKFFAQFFSVEFGFCLFFFPKSLRSVFFLNFFHSGIEN